MSGTGGNSNHLCTQCRPHGPSRLFKSHAVGPSRTLYSTSRATLPRRQHWQPSGCRRYRLSAGSEKNELMSRRPSAAPLGCAGRGAAPVAPAATAPSRATPSPAKADPGPPAQACGGQASIFGPAGGRPQLASPGPRPARIRVPESGTGMSGTAWQPGRPAIVAGPGQPVLQVAGRRDGAAVLVSVIAPPAWPVNRPPPRPPQQWPHPGPAACLCSLSAAAATGPRRPPGGPGHESLALSQARPRPGPGASHGPNTCHGPVMAAPASARLGFRLSVGRDSGH